MRKPRAIIAIACVLSISALSGAATIFSDNFTDTNASKVKWNSLAAAGFSASYQGGALVLNNPDQTYTAFFMHLFAGTKPSTFTLSATFIITDPAVNGAGLMFCLNNPSSPTGYTLQLGTTQYLFCYRYTSNSADDLKSKFSPFVKELPASNTLKVSKSGTTFNVFCNDHYVTRFSDVTFTGGDIAILVPPQAAIKVDDVIMTDQAETPPVSACYSDSFLTTASDAWSAPSAGEAIFGGGRLVLNNTDATYSGTIYTDGVSPTASIKAVVSHKSGSGAYGVAFVESDSNMVKPFAFCIDSSRRYSFVNPDSSSISSHIGIGIYGALGTDTIEVLQFAKKWLFVVNGAVQDSVNIPSTFRVDGFGLYASKKTALTCTYFVAGGDSTGAVCNHTPVVARIPTPGPKYAASVFCKGSTVFDMRGRMVGTFDRVGFLKAMLPAGLYFVVPAGRKAGSVPAIPVLKTGN
jgi:hypothetical protein